MGTKHLLSFLLLITILSCKKKTTEEVQPQPQPVQRQVTYRIGCTNCDVIYYKSGLAQGSEYNKNSTWSYTFDGVKGDVVLLMAYNRGAFPEGINATIMLNNDTLVSRTTHCPVSGYSFVTDTLK